MPGSSAAAPYSVRYSAKVFRKFRKRLHKCTHIQNHFKFLLVKKLPPIIWAFPGKQRKVHINDSAEIWAIFVFSSPSAAFSSSRCLPLGERQPIRIAYCHWNPTGRWSRLLLFCAWPFCSWSTTLAPPAKKKLPPFLLHLLPPFRPPPGKPLLFCWLVVGKPVYKDSLSLCLTAIFKIHSPPTVLAWSQGCHRE